MTTFAAPMAPRELGHNRIQKYVFDAAVIAEDFVAAATTKRFGQLLSWVTLRTTLPERNSSANPPELDLAFVPLANNQSLACVNPSFTQVIDCSRRRNSLFCKRALIAARPGTNSSRMATGFQPMEMKEVAMSIMSKLQKISIAAGTAFGLGAISCSAGELPQYEAAGFPISPHQITVLGLGNIREKPPIPALTLNGMPVSPNQIAVLQPPWQLAPLDKMIIDLAEEIEVNTTQPAIGTRANLIVRLARAKAQWTKRSDNHSETN
jgi:hypothetical protein